MDAFDTAMAAYQPDGNEYFSIFGQTFEYRHLIHWSEEKIGKRRIKETYDCFPPTIQTVDEWLSSSLLPSERMLTRCRGKVFVVPQTGSSRQLTKAYLKLQVSSD